MFCPRTFKYVPVLLTFCPILASCWPLRKMRLAVRSPGSVQGHKAWAEVDLHPVLPCQLSNHGSVQNANVSSCSVINDGIPWNISPLELAVFPGAGRDIVKGRGPSAISGCSLELPWCRCQDLGQSYAWDAIPEPGPPCNLHLVWAYHRNLYPSKASHQQEHSRSLTLEVPFGAPPSHALFAPGRSYRASGIPSLHPGRHHLLITCSLPAL